jgi:hypothetical protein
MHIGFRHVPPAHPPDAPELLPPPSDPELLPLELLLASSPASLPELPPDVLPELDPEPEPLPDVLPELLAPLLPPELLPPLVDPLFPPDPLPLLVDPLLPPELPPPDEPPLVLPFPVSVELSDPHPGATHAAASKPAVANSQKGNFMIPISRAQVPTRTGAQPRPRLFRERVALRSPMPA